MRIVQKQGFKTVKSIKTKQKRKKSFLAATVRNIEPDVGEFDWDGGMKRAGLRVRGCHCIVAGV